MSDVIRQSHAAKCDWPGCGVLGSDDEWIGWPSYKDAIEVLEDQPEGQNWYHDAENRRDYCGRHWHWEDDERVPGPDLGRFKKFKGESMTATLQNEAAENARQQAVKAKATVDEAISWLRCAAASYDTADQAHEAMACMPTILSLMAISTEIGELNKQLDREEDA